EWHRGTSLCGAFCHNEARQLHCQACRAGVSSRESPHRVSGMRVAETVPTLETRRARWGRPRAMPGAVLSAALAVLFPLAARADTTPPALLSFAFSPASIDTTSGSAGVVVTARITDDLSGVASMRVVFSHRDVMTEPHDCETTVPASGTALDGVFTCTAVFPQFSESGTWRVFVVELSDVAG